MGEIMRRLLSLLVLPAILVLPVFRAFSQTAGQNINMVSGTTLPGGDPYLQRQNEPSIAASSRNAARLMAGANDYRTVDIAAPAGVTDETGDAWLGVFKSFDGGATWQSTLLPGYPQDTTAVGLASPLHGFSTGADPLVRAGTNGLFYYSGIVFNRGTNQGEVFVSRFIDLANKENGDPIQYLDAAVIDGGTSGQFLDKPWLAVDVPRGSATCTISTKQDGKTVTQTIPAGNVYIGYSAFVGGTNNTHTQILVARSTDCGQTWTKPTKLSESYQVNQGTSIAIDPTNGTVYVAWRQFSSTNTPNAVLVAKSTDGGNSFSKVTTVQSLPDFNLATPATPAFFDQGISSTMFRSNAYPTLGVDGSGVVYLAWSQRGVNGNADARIVLSTSSNGVNWSAPTPIDNTAIIDTAGTSFTHGSQLMPSLTVAGGKVMVLYYDQREDHTVGQYSLLRTPANDLFYSETRVPISGDGGTPDASTAIFTPFISDAGLGTRHTLDVRVSQADTSRSPLFQSAYVSHYQFGVFDGQSSMDTSLHQFQLNPPNLPMFQGGTVPFMGDYIEIGNRAFLSPAEANSNNWQFNVGTSGSSVGFASWTSNQDVRPPANGDWQLTNPACQVAPLDGSRNQNIYFSRISQGFSFLAPQQNKPLRTDLQRAFVLDLFNSTDQQHSFALTLPAQPAGNGWASFVVAPTPLSNPLPSATTTIHVTLAPRSGATRSVFALSTNATAPIQVRAIEIPNPGAASVAGTALSGFIVLNGDSTVPPLVNPDSAPGLPGIQTLELYTPNISNPNISNPNISNVNLANPNISNPNISNPNISNPNISNPNISNPNISNPNISNPNISNPNISNPNISNQSISNTAVSDINYTVTNNGNTNTGYQVRLVQLASVPGSPKLQLILSRNYNTPVSLGCQLLQESTNIPIANVVNPTTISPSDVGSNTSNLQDPEQNPTLHLAPGESAVITIRGFVEQSEMQGISDAIVPAVLAEGLSGSGNAVAPLRLLSQTFNYILQGEQHSFTLTPFGGTAPYVWSPVSLPAGFLLDPATGTVTVPSNTPAGLYTFSVQIKDATGATAIQSYSILVVAPLQITTKTLPDGIAASQNYRTSLASTGGTSPVSWSVTTGHTLPTGLALSSSGGLASNGTALVAGSYDVYVTVTDSTPGTPLTASTKLTLRVNQLLSVSFSSLPDAVIGAFYDAPLTSTGGVTPYVWSVSGNLPAGLALGTYNNVPAIYGTPTAAVSTTFTLTVQDASSPNQSASSLQTIRVSSPLSITTASLPNGSGGSAYNAALAATGGQPPLTWSVSSGSLPAGLALNATTGALSGTPTGSGSFPFTVTVRDASTPAQTASHAYTLVITQQLTLIFTAQPSNSSPGSQITPSIKVQVLTASGANVPNATVTLTIESNPGGSTLTGSTVATTSNKGIALFPSNTLNNSGVNYTLRATAITSTGATGTVVSAPFSVR